MTSVLKAISPPKITGRRRRRSSPGVTLGRVVMAIGAVAMVAPVWWALAMALSSARAAFGNSPNWFPQMMTWANFDYVLRETPLLTWAANSFLVATVATIGALLTSVLAGYTFACLQFPGRNLLFVAFLASMMVPQQATLVPTFIMMRMVGLIDTQASLFLPGMFSAFGVFFMRQFFLTLPKELGEAAKIDGAGHYRTFWLIMMPQAVAPLAALAIFVFQHWWNDFFWANVFLYSEEKFTLPLGLVRLQGLYGTTPTVVVFAAIAVVSVPILIVFVFTQKYLTESLARTGLGG